MKAANFIGACFFIINSLLLYTRVTTSGLPEAGKKHVSLVSKTTLYVANLLTAPKDNVYLQLI